MVDVEMTMVLRKNGQLRRLNTTGELYDLWSHFFYIYKNSSPFVFVMFFITTTVRRISDIVLPESHLVLLLLTV